MTIVIRDRRRALWIVGGLTLLVAAVIAGLVIWRLNPTEVAILEVLHPDDHRSVYSWEEIAELDALLLSVNACNGQHDARVVHQDDSRIEILVTTHQLRLLGVDDCADLVSISLGHPVGNRLLVDASTGARIKRRSPVDDSPTT